MGIPEKDKKFAEEYNNISGNPNLADVAIKLGLSVKTVQNTAALLRRKRMSDPETPELISRAALSSSVTTSRTVEVPVLPEKHEDISELIERAIKHNERVVAHHDAKKVLDVKVNVDGPIGVVGIPDPHLNNPGTLLKKAFADAEVIRNTEGLFCVGIGDWLDNFIIGRLERERRGDIMSHSDAVRLQEHYVTQIAEKLIAAVGGNHNDWPTSLGGEDNLAKLFNELGIGSIYDADQVRVRLNTPNGRSFMHLVRHRYPGTSRVNPVHGIMTWMTERWQGEDVFWGGHTHNAGVFISEKQWEGSRRVIHGVQLATYKEIDGYATKEGFKENVPFITPMIVHDPENGKTHFMDDIETGKDFLKYLRRKY